MAFSGSASETRCVAVHRLDRAATRWRGEPGLIARSCQSPAHGAWPHRPGSRQPFPCHHVRQGGASSLREEGNPYRHAGAGRHGSCRVHRRENATGPHGQHRASGLPFLTRITRDRHPH
ncbi:hypothetical protein [Komagataeibacter sp. FXV3]|uniref:hypothetical protein n=1 Tax=Komagataeibacter sp. FXV3 TaxID=2608998 RepID=UPI00187B3B6C|nr:hypothetical protein [Komagataeibacter sp. FXV3]